MTVRNYQQVYDITSSIDIDDVDKSAWLVCYVFGYIDEQVNNMKPKRFLKLLDKASRRMNKSNTPIWYGSELNTDASVITLGQFIEAIHWLKGGIIESIHLIAATMLGGECHKERAAKILNSNVRLYLPYVIEFAKSLNELLQSYSGLFEIEELEPGVKPSPPHPFISQYGWIYSATQVAGFEGIPIDEAYKLPIVQALNDLSYLKAKQKYDEKMNK
jgi:hypothetical protein